MTSPNTLIADLQAENDALRKQRDDLLSALERILLNDGSGGSKCFDAFVLYDARRDGFEAIASVKGCA